MEISLTAVRCSVAMATYNGARFLEPQLHSLATQTLLPIELVVRDDGSTDDTLAIVEHFTGGAPFPVYVHRNPRKVDYSDNFLNAARLCTGDWIAFCDQDDVWEPQKLARIFAEIQKRPAVVFCAHRATIINEHSQTVGALLVPKVDRVREYAPLDQTLWWSPFGFTQVFDARLVRNFPFEERPPGTTHDCWAFWLGNILGHTLFLPDRLALYRRHSNNASSFTVNPSAGAQLTAENGGRQYLEAKQKVSRLVAYLRERVPEHAGEVAARLAEAAERYERLATFLVERAIIWDQHSPTVSKIRAFLKLVSKGAYLDRKKGRIGFAAGCKDLLRLILFAPR